MARGKLSPEEIKALEANPYVEDVDQKRVVYTNAFKRHFMEEYLNGKKPTQIFREAGFDTDILGSKRIERATARWKESYASGTLTHRGPISLRGKRAIKELKFEKKKVRKYKSENAKLSIRLVRSEAQLDKEHIAHLEKVKKLSNDKDLKISKQQAKIESLEAQVELLKKVGKIGRRRCEKKVFGKIDLCEIIEQIIIEHKLTGLTKKLCELVGLPRSTYYYYLNTKESRQIKEERDCEKLFFIKKAFNRNSYYKKGSRSVQMTLSEDMGIRMNRKCIQRIMRKYMLVCPIRTKNPYKDIWKATKEDRIAPNLLHRNFKPGEARKVLLTDITYIKHQGQFAYLSVILDSQSNEPLAYKLSQNLKMDFVLDSLEQLDTSTFANGIILHSDQGVHYTSKQFRNKLKKLNIQQSMSRRGNCLDNSPMESFFGHMKQEAHFDKNSSFEELKTVVDKYMKYYTYERRQCVLNRMTPFEYGNTLLSVA